MKCVNDICDAMTLSISVSQLLKTQTIGNKMRRDGITSEELNNESESLINQLLSIYVEYVNTL